MTDASLLQLFQMELEEHAVALDEGLLELENNPHALDRFEPLMRAAHSIKGSARVVELEAAVQIAHAMEDCFVAFQKKSAPFKQKSVDVLLKGVDMLRAVAKAGTSDDTNWLSSHQDKIDAFIKSTQKLIENNAFEVLAGASASFPINATVTDRKTADGKGSSAEMKLSPDKSETGLPLKEKGILQEEASSSKAVVAHDRAVRVTAEKIEKLIGLTSEMAVNAGWLPSFTQSLLSLKKDHESLLEVLENLREILKQETRNDQIHDQTHDQIHDLIIKALGKTRQSEACFMDYFKRLESFSNRSATLCDLLCHQVVGIRMRPFADGVQGFPRMVRDIARKLDKQLSFEIKGQSTELDREILTRSITVSNRRGNECVPGNRRKAPYALKPRIARACS